ncbi:MAG: hypothetical protein Q8O19_03860 [Rectinemataceae bacterium]|nr:hypothetical protein [Rectinemataceae bacterium]
MSKNWNGLTARQHETAKAAFEALVTYDALIPSEARSGGATNHDSIRNYFDWINGSSSQTMPTSLQRTLMNNPRVRRDFDRLLKRAAGWHCGRAAAASSGLLDEREGKGFRLRLLASRGVAGQVYILIELAPDTSAEPNVMVVRGALGECFRLSLPLSQAGSIQVLSKEETEIVRLLRDPKSEIFLW